MSNPAARALLRTRFARPQAGTRSYDVVAARTRTSIAARTPSQHQPLLVLSAYPAPQQPQLCIAQNVRAFHASAGLYKKKKNAKNSTIKSGVLSKSNEIFTSLGDEGGSEETESKHPKPDPSDPLNFADVNSRIEGINEKYSTKLKRMRAGAFDSDSIGSLAVLVDKSAGTAYPLRELAAVVPRGGRTVSLLVHEASYIKPIMSAVQGSPDFNQQPQRDPDNELELVLRIEPEQPEELKTRFKTLTNQWQEALRGVRRKRMSKHSVWKKEGLFGVDAKKQADEHLEKVMKPVMAQAEKECQAALKAVEG
ncbi:ribosome recycling factor [Nemania sp. FL0916]|nr:ribosome recycling factor [Nemania sp. FL0916]